MVRQQTINQALSILGLAGRFSPMGEAGVQKEKDKAEQREIERGLAKAERTAEQGRIAETPAELSVQKKIAKQGVEAYQKKFFHNPTDENYEQFVRAQTDVEELASEDPSVRSYKTPSEIATEKARKSSELATERAREAAEKAKIEEQARMANYSPEDWTKHFEKIKAERIKPKEEGNNV